MWSISWHDNVGRTNGSIQAVTLPDLDDDLRKQCLHLLYKLCKPHELLPASYVLQQEHIRVGNALRFGGSADVVEGEYLGRRVAIKHLRFGAKDALNMIFKVFQVIPRLVASHYSVYV